MRRHQTLTLTLAAAGVLLAVLAAAPAARAQTPVAPTQTAAASGVAPLTFQNALDLAVANNLELAAARRGRAVREADLKAAGQRANPELSADLSRDSPHGEVSLALPIDLARTRARRIDMANAALAMADVEEHSALVALRRDVRLAFYGLMAADQQVALAETVLGIVERTKDAVQLRFDAGAVPRLDVLQADIGLVRGRADLDLARSSRRAAQAALNALLNRPPDQPVVLAGDLADIPALPALDRATATALAANVDLLAIDRQSAIERRTLDFLKADRLPNSTVIAGGLFNAPGEYTAGAHAGFSLTLPLFARNQGEIAGSQARLSQIALRRDSLRRQVEARVYAALERVTAMRAQAEAFRTALLPAAASLQDMAQVSYTLGRSSILVLLDAQRSLRDARYDYVQALLDLQAAVADLEDILGGPIR